MAELTPLFMDISNVYSGDDLGMPWRDVIGEGVVGSGDLAVTQRAAGADLSVDVAAGAAWVTGDTNPDAQPTYRVRNDATVNLGISPDPSNPRKVVIVAQITDESFAGVGRQWQLQAVHGTPAASPAEPALPPSALKLAVITVPAAASSIVTADIVDARVRAKVGGGTVLGAGAELAYEELASAVNVVGNGTGTASTIIDLGSLSYDGSRVCLEFQAWAYFTSGFSAGDVIVPVLCDGGTVVELFNYVQAQQASHAEGHHYYARYFFTPSAGSHDYAIKAYGTNPSSSRYQLGGGEQPAFLRITKA